jgi:hypothetical protein
VPLSVASPSAPEPKSAPTVAPAGPLAPVPPGVPASPFGPGSPFAPGFPLAPAGPTDPFNCGWACLLIFCSVTAPFFSCLVPTLLGASLLAA